MTAQASDRQLVSPGKRPMTLVRPWGSKTQIRSCGASVVLVDEPAEQVPPADVPRADWDWVRGFGHRWREGEPSMGPPAVVVLGVGPEGAIEVPPAEDRGRRASGARRSPR